MTWRPWVGYVVVFVASACTLVLEIAAGRLLAPYIGASLYTWTSVIGVVLAGISLGNYLGGVVADRAGSRRTLGRFWSRAGWRAWPSCRSRRPIWSVWCRAACRSSPGSSS